MPNSPSVNGSNSWWNGRWRRIPSIRLLISWNCQTKEFCYLLTNLLAQRYPLDMIYRAYKWRWQVELLF